MGNKDVQIDTGLDVQASLWVYYLKPIQRDLNDWIIKEYKIYINEWVLRNKKEMDIYFERGEKLTKFRFKVIGEGPVYDYRVEKSYYTVNELKELLEVKQYKKDLVGMHMGLKEVDGKLIVDLMKMIGIENLYGNILSENDIAMVSL